MYRSIPHMQIKVYTLTPKIINKIIDKVEELFFRTDSGYTCKLKKKTSEKVSNKCSRIIGILNRLKHTLPNEYK